jgi:hypothetical protein
MTTRKEQSKARRGSVILPQPQRRTSLGPTTDETVSSNISSAGKKAKRSASVLLETPFVDQRESQEDASIASDESVAEGLRLEIEQLRKMLEQVHFQLHEQGMIIDQQRQEINSLKAVYNDHEVKLNHVMTSTKNPDVPLHPPMSYKEVLKAGLPTLTSSIFNEQAERKRRAHNIVIKDKRISQLSLIQPSRDPTTVVQAWLLAHGATTDDLEKSSVRVVPTKLAANETTPQTKGHTIIVTLPNVEDRYVLIGKIKRSLRPSASNKNEENHVYIDPDLTPVEAQEQYSLRLERNKLNSSRSEDEKLKYYYHIRRGKVIKVTI